MDSDNGSESSTWNQVKDRIKSYIFEIANDSSTFVNKTRVKISRFVRVVELEIRTRRNEDSRRPKLCIIEATPPAEPHSDFFI